MAACGTCGTENPDGARFCNGCGSPLAAPTIAPTPGPARPAAPGPAPAAPREERRVVTMLFADLAGFTTRSEQLDPEDVRAFLVPYYEVMRSEIDRHGGTVERYLGDGIMAVFGAPVAHEDDPERAIRAALRITERVAALGLDLHVRIGINTGEILFRYDAANRDDVVTGDAANTAARLQGLAPVDGVVVGEATWRATRRVFEYVELPPTTVKGKAEPIRVLQPTAPRARLGGEVSRTYDTPYVGRAAELDALVGAFEAAVGERRPRLVTVVGEPGIGKSRLLAELGRHVDARPELVAWRQGRCLSYGDGITFWALGEIVKAHAGIFETDDPAIASSKIGAVVVDQADRDWLHQRLLPLVGVAGGALAARDELFAAWTAFIASIAGNGPAVVVVEDLHWADPAMLAFLEHVAASAGDVPLLLVGTARPDLFESAPGFASTLGNATRVELRPLVDAEAGALIEALIGSVVPDELREPILERAAGNPLYVEELVRLLRDRDLLVEGIGGATLRPGATLPLPESISALLAARLDTLPQHRRTLLGNAAVVGKVFWTGAVASLSDRDRADVAPDLDALSRRELVRPVSTSSIAGEDEYVFWHVLARDVAYGQLPRSARAALHVSAAKWLEARAGERAADIAELLAYHWSTALDLARAAGRTDDLPDLEARALEWLFAAGRKARGLDTAAALASLERALALAPPGHQRRPEVLLEFGQATRDAGRLLAAIDALEEATAIYRERGDLVGEARVHSPLDTIQRRIGDPSRYIPRSVVERLRSGLPPGPELVEVLTAEGVGRFLDGDPTAGLRWADQAIQLATGLGLGEPARALSFRGASRLALNDRGGIDDMRRAIDLAIAAGNGPLAALGYYNLAPSVVGFDGAEAAVAYIEEGLAFARRRGLLDFISGFEANLATFLLDGADVERGLATVASALAHIAPEDRKARLDLRARRLRARTARGDAADLVEELAWVDRTAADMANDENLAYALVVRCGTLAALGDIEAAAAVIRSLEASTAFRATESYRFDLPDLVQLALLAGDAMLAARLVDGTEPFGPGEIHAHRVATAYLAEARGDFGEAAAMLADEAAYWEKYGMLVRAGDASFARGRCLVKLGRIPEARQAFADARSAFKRYGAAPRLAELEAILAGLDGGGSSAQSSNSDT